MITITGAQIGIILGAVSLLGTVFGVFFYFQKPQIAIEKRVKSLEDELNNTKSDIAEFKKLHFDANDGLQKEFKEMTIAMNNLDKTVVRLSTIIEERIPRADPNLTPKGT